MSQENVEVVRAVFETWNAGDMDALRELHDPDAIMRPPEDWPESGPFFGREALMRQWEQQRDTWDADALEPISDFIDGADRVVVRFIWRGAGHGPDANLELTGVYTVRKGRIAFFEFFWDHAEALETLGLSEEMALQANVETIRRMVESANASGWDSESVVNDWVHPEGRMYPAPDFPGSDVYVGREEMGGFIREWTSTFDDLRWELEQLIDLDDRVVVLARMVGKSRTTGTAIDWPFGGVFADFRDGTFAEARFFMDQKGALEAVDLSEQDAHADPS
jgi:ketosteroid isomerase-like protein